MKNKTNSIKNFAILLAMSAGFLFTSCEKEPIVPELTTKEQEEIVNSAPELANPLSDLSLYETFGSFTLDLSKVFMDADNDALTFSAKSLEGNISVSLVYGDSLMVSLEDPAIIADETIVITVDDGNGETAETDFYFSTELDASYRVIGTWAHLCGDTLSLNADNTYAFSMQSGSNTLTCTGTYSVNRETKILTDNDKQLWSFPVNVSFNEEMDELSLNNSTYNKVK